MTGYSVRKLKLTVEEVLHDGGPALAAPLKVGCAMAVVANPFAGRYEPDLIPFQTALRGLGLELAARLTEALGGAAAIEAYGKGAIVGINGEIEHGAVWHEAGGWAMRELLGGPKAIVPSAKTIGVPGTRLMLPLGHIEASYVRSHLSTAEMTLWDGPRPDEILFGLVMATGGRPNARLGGLTVDQISVHDGQR